KTKGFTIPYALDVLRDYGAGTVEVINVWNPATHKTTATAIAYTFPTTGASADKIQLQQVTGTSPTQTVVADTTAEGLTGTFSVTNAAGSTTYVVDTDYTINLITGELKRVVGGAITAGLAVKVTYTYADPSKVTASDVIGAVVLGDRTGLQAALDVAPLRGYKPKVLIAPWFSELPTVATELASMGDRLGAYFGIDAPAGVTRDEAIAGRGGTGVAAVFGTSNRRAMLCYPRIENSDGLMVPMSVHVAGAIAFTDANFGYSQSPSNQEMKNAVRPEVRLTGDFTDPNTDVNALNAAGIITVFSGYGTGFRTWGNRSGLYPSDTTPLNFVAVGRTLDIFQESLQQASLPFVDRRINNALIDIIEATGNGFVREEILAGNLLEGSRLYYDPAKNPSTAIAAGKVVFSVVIAIPTPAERIVYETTIDINLYSQIGQQQ
ncbi:MAG TPA: phage tail sheath subtilisin-like domain-containing protein, partial [Chroococcidiopsis sp.]